MGRRSYKTEASIIFIVALVIAAIYILKGIAFVIEFLINKIKGFIESFKLAWSDPSTRIAIIVGISLFILFTILITSAIIRNKKEKERIAREREIEYQKEQERLAKLEEKRWQRELEAKRKEAERLEHERLEKEYQHGYRDDMTGGEYEKYCADLFKYFSWDASVTKLSGDYGADVIAKKDGVEIIVQCKKWSGKIGFKAVQEIYTAKTIYKANIAMIITNSTFSPAAIKGAKETDVILVRHPDLENVLNKIDKLIEGAKAKLQE